LITTLPAKVPDDENLLWLATGTLFTRYLTGTMTRRCSTLNHENSRVFIEIRDRRFYKMLCKGWENWFEKQLKQY